MRYWNYLKGETVCSFLVELLAPSLPRTKIIFIADRAPKQLKPKAQKIDERHTIVITLREGLIELISWVRNLFLKSFLVSFPSFMKFHSQVIALMRG